MTPPQLTCALCGNHLLEDAALALKIRAASSPSSIFSFPAPIALSASRILAAGGIRLALQRVPALPNVTTNHKG